MIKILINKKDFYNIKHLKYFNLCLFAGLRKVYPYYFTFTTFTKGRWVGERILDVFAREFRAHPAAEYERCIRAGTLTVNYERVDPDYRLKHNDLLANVVHRYNIIFSINKKTVDSLKLRHFVALVLRHTLYTQTL